MITSTTFSLFAELGDAKHKGKGDAKPKGSPARCKI
jgi:hypothetical protein